MTIDSFSGDYRFLSNFYELGSKPTVEHIFQAMKTQDLDEQVWVLSSPSPGSAKRRGRKVTLRNDWEDIKINVMEQCLRHKFAEPILQKMLLSTGNQDLIEGNGWGDTFWGVCNGEGRNELGKLLMKLREEYRNDNHQS